MMSNATSASARSRIESILDDNSFVEIGAGVKARATDFNLTAKNTLSDGVITGYGVINGNLVYVYIRYERYNRRNACEEDSWLV